MYVVHMCSASVAIKLVLRTYNIYIIMCDNHGALLWRCTSSCTHH